MSISGWAVGMFVGIVLITLVDTGRPSPLWAAQFPMQGILDCMRVVGGAPASVCTLVLSPPLTVDVLWPDTWTPALTPLKSETGIVSLINPFFPKFLSVRMFYHSSSNEGRTVMKPQMMYFSDSFFVFSYRQLYLCVSSQGRMRCG